MATHSKLERKKREEQPPELPLVLANLERRLREKPHTRGELVAWLDSKHTWCEWKGTISEHLFETASGPRSALDAFRSANASVDVELRESDGAELWVYRLTYSFRNKHGLEKAIRGSRAGLMLSELVAHMEGEYKEIKQDIDALLREKRIFAVDDDRTGGKRGKVLFACIDRDNVQALYADRETRAAYHELAVPEHAKVLEVLQNSEFRVPEDIYRRKRDQMGAVAQSSRPAPAARKRPRSRNVTNPQLLGL